MKMRPYAFIGEDEIDHNGEIFHYIQELHAYLWQFIWAVTPDASGTINDNVDRAVETLEARESKVAALVNAVQVVEWVQGDDPHDDGFDFCPWCRNWTKHGHAGDCQRQAALAAFEVPE